MKTITIFLALVFSLGISAQGNEPIFEKEGDKVKATYYHDNGQIAQTGYFLAGKLHGEWKMYDEEGEKVAIGNYEQGKRTGKWFFWEGNTLKEVDFTDNKIANVQSKDTKPVVVNK